MKRRDFVSALPLASVAPLALRVGPVASLLSASANAQPASQSTWDKVKSTKVLRVGAAILEPWYFKDSSGSDAPGKVSVGNDVWRGIGPLLAAEAAQALGVRLELVETTWGNAVAGLQAQQFDVMFMLDATPQRAQAVDFVSAPLLWYPLALLANDKVNIQKWADLDDPKYRIGVALGTNSDEYVTQAAPKATISRFQNSGEIFAAFQSGRTDAGVVSAVAADLARARLKSGKTVVPQPFVAVPGGTAVRKEADPRWLNFFNTFANDVYKSGKTQQFYEQFLAFRGVDPKHAVPVQRERW